MSLSYALIKVRQVTEPSLTSDPGNQLGGSTFACTEESGLDYPSTGDNQQYF